MNDGPLPERFWKKVDKTASCWLWTASLAKGYGQFHMNGALRMAHRVAYEALIGPIAVGLDLDHLCRVPRCVNPDHLEPVTHRENVLRSESFAAKQVMRTECPHGHP